MKSNGHGYSIDELVGFGADREQVIAAFKEVAKDDSTAVGITAKSEYTDEIDEKTGFWKIDHRGRLEGCTFYPLKKVYDKKLEHTVYVIQGIGEYDAMNHDYALLYDAWDCRHALREAGIRY